MQIFAKKHFLTADAKLFTFLINLAIYLRAGISIFKRIFDHLTPLIVDYLAITIGLFYIKEWYQNFSGINYPSDLSTIGIFAYALIWIVSIFFCGGYDKPVSLKSTAKIGRAHV